MKMIFFKSYLVRNNIIISYDINNKYKKYTRDLEDIL